MEYILGRFSISLFLESLTRRGNHYSESKTITNKSSLRTLKYAQQTFNNNHKHQTTTWIMVESSSSKWLEKRHLSVINESIRNVNDVCILNIIIIFFLPRKLQFFVIQGRCRSSRPRHLRLQQWANAWGQLGSSHTSSKVILKLVLCGILL